MKQFVCKCGRRKETSDNKVIVLCNSCGNFMQERENIRYIKFKEKKRDDRRTAF